MAFHLDDIREAKMVFWLETLRMWTIAAPIAFNILCQYGTNSVTNIFVGHIGDVQLSVVAISLSVAGTFSSGFMKFLQAQSKVSALAWIGFIALIIHVGLLWLFISVFKWGTTGAAVAYDMTSWGITVAQVLYVFPLCKEGWKAFARLSLASAVMLCVEIWHMMSMSGHLDNAVIAVDPLSIW